MTTTAVVWFRYRFQDIYWTRVRRDRVRYYVNTNVAVATRVSTNSFFRFQFFVNKISIVVRAIKEIDAMTF